MRNILISVPGKKDKLPLSVTHPELAKEADGWDPETIFIGFKKLKWICSSGHKWEALVSSRTRGQSCPYCSGRRVLAGFNDLQTLNPELASQANGWDPTYFTTGSHMKLSWKGTCSHIWEASINQRLRGRGCPICAGKIIVAGVNDFASQRPNKALEAFGWDPSKVSLNSGKKKDWKCSIGHIWTTRVADRAAGSECPICQNDVVLKGFNDLLTINPTLAAEADGWDPSTVTQGSEKIRHWKCTLGHSWKASIDSRSAGNGCPYCANKKILKGFNDLESKFPVIAAEAFGWDPSKVTAFSSKNLVWQCEQGHRWKTTVATRTGGSNCPSCSKTGFDPNKKGFIYFVQHNGWQMFQIGITNFPDERLKDHRKLGWELLELRGPMDGHLTQKWETAILRMLKAKGADLSNSKITGKFDGYSEAWSKSTFEVKSIKELMRLTEDFEEKK